MRHIPANRGPDHTGSGTDPLAAPLAFAQGLDFQRYTAPWRPSLGSARLRFGPALERSFETATQAARVRELRLTITLSVVFYLLTIATDRVLVPDIGWLGTALRLCTVPVWAVLVLFAHRFSAGLREGYAVSLATFAVLLLAAIAFFSTRTTRCASAAPAQARQSRSRARSAWCSPTPTSASAWPGR